jgi:hypothetical protein
LKHKKRRTVGRPTGSRSVGLTRLKRINPNIELSDRQMGVECGVDGCAIRLRESRNLDLHRKSHRSQPPNLFECPECSNSEFRTDSVETFAFRSWPKLALHLWRCHRVDMELFSCPDCKNFRSYTRSGLVISYSWRHDRQSNRQAIHIIQNKNRQNSTSRGNCVLSYKGEVKIGVRRHSA